MNNEQQQTMVPGTEVPTSKLKLPKKINVKWVVIAVLVLALVALVFYYKSIFVAAVVNGQPITRLQVINELEKQSGKTALDTLVNESLINHEAEAKGVTINDEELNEAVKKIEKQITDQGSNLDDELKAQGLSRDDFEEQVMLQKKAEKLLSDKIQVSDEEVNAYITDNEVSIPEGKEAEAKDQVKEQLKSQKFGQEVATWLEELHSKAKIKFFVTY